MRTLAALLVVIAAASATAQPLERRQPPTQVRDIFPAPETAPEIRTAMKAAMEVKGWGALPTTPADLMKELGVKLELCRHVTEFSRGNYAYTVTCFQTGAADGNMYVGEDDDYRQYFDKKWNGKRAALRALATSGSSVVVEQFHTALVKDDEAYIWFLYYTKDGCKHPRYWRLVRVTKKGDLTWVGDDMQEAGGEPADVKGKCINVEKKGRRL
ncbi:MAG: hypothetical protein HY904_10375 [Deltaproteobacteria bacterium]|nr:hypothetical protein [Deltaproteobacteria bacterium]